MTYPFIFDRNFGVAEGFGSKGLPTEIRRAGFPRPRKTESFEALADGTYLFILLSKLVKILILTKGARGTLYKGKK